jgi:hypothetical protein
MAIIFAFACQMTEPKILEWFRRMGVQISAGQISNSLIKDHYQFHGEKDAVYEAGLSSNPWQHLDDTATRVNGQNQYSQVVANPIYTSYLTTPSKGRLSVIDVLRNGPPRQFRLNGEALGYLEAAGVSAEDQLWAAGGRGNQVVGHFHVAGWDHQEVGSQLLPLRPGPNFRSESDTAAIQHH